MKKEKKYNYFYRIENKINGKYYYGIHSTEDLNDGYMGSGKRLQIAYKKYGIENFEKRILKYFPNRSELSEYESNFVSETLIEDDLCYNIILGGEKFNTIGHTACFDKINNNMVLIKTEIYHNNHDRYINTNSNTVIVQNIKHGTWHRINNTEFIKNRNEYKTPTEGFVNVINSKNEIFLVKKDDERIKNGELKYLFSNKLHTEKTKQKISETQRKNGSQVGEKNSNYGKKWIYRINNDSIETISVKKELVENYLNEGWKLGRKILKKYNYKNALINNIDIEQFKKDYENGFSIKKLSEKYNLSYSYTQKILTRKNIKKKA